MINKVNRSWDWRFYDLIPKRLKQLRACYNRKLIKVSHNDELTINDRTDFQQRGDRSEKDRKRDNEKKAYRYWTRTRLNERLFILDHRICFDESHAKDQAKGQWPAGLEIRRL
jgi:hypothetical protein